MADAQTLPAEAVGLAQAAFLHIPGTVGPGFLAALTGLYGERGLRRVPRAGPSAVEGAAPALLHGPAPWHAWRGHGPLRPFTMLRHPVARVQALFRTTTAEPPEMLARWGLEPGFTFEAFIGATHRGIREHVANGMCRMLATDPAFTTPGGPAFDDPEAVPRLLDEAVGTLAAMPFGLAEALPESLEALRRAWDIGFALHAPAEPEAPAGPETAPHAIARIAACNALDIALYETARTLFAGRAAGFTPLAFRVDPRGIFAPPAGSWIDIADIPGRQGFHPVETHGVAWLDAEATPLLHFRAPRQASTLSLRLLCVAEGYPVPRIRLQLDGRPLRFTAEQEGRWATLKTEQLDFAGRPHALSVAAPYAVPVRALSPGSTDPRRLSVGIAKLLFGA